MSLLKNTAKKLIEKLDGILESLNLIRITRHLSILKSYTEQYFRKGYEQGYKKAGDELDLTLSYKPVDYDADIAKSYLVPSTSLGITTAIANQIQNDLFTESPNNPIVPKRSQQALILSNKRNILVNAGAGAGKSTTLVQRIYVMYRYLNIPLTKITVFSFTRASCDDFRKKLREYFAQRDIELTDEDLKSIVRTFHSKVYHFAKGIIFNGTNPRIFEFLKEKELSEEEREDTDNMRVSDLSKPQISILKKVYDKLYSEDSEFKVRIQRLIELAFIQWKRKTYEKGYSEDLKDKAEKAKNHVIRRDKELTVDCYNDIFSLSLEPALVEIPLTRLPTRQVLHANYYVKSQDLYVVIAPDSNTCDKYFKGKKTTDGYNLWVACRNKIDLLELYSGIENIFYVRNIEDAKYLENNLKSLNNSSSIAPTFDILLDGEYKPSHIFEAFYKTGTFIESTGIRVQDIEFKIENIPSLSELDLLFAKTLVTFWNSFETHLTTAERCYRFTDFFRAFGDPKSDNFKQITSAMLESMQHIIIDEFQDISPLEVMWVQAVMRRLSSQNIDNSLICVGDDYQSIYGWRGSSPEFIMNYKEKFPSKHLDDLKIEENFRSYSNIVTPAEYVLDQIPPENRTHKSGNCVNGEGGNGIKMIIEFDQKYILDHLSDLEIQLDGSDDDLDVLVLARSNNVIDDTSTAFFKQKTKFEIEQSPFRFETFHRSKGLQATYTVLLNDCSYNSTNNLRNAIYELCGQFNCTYDEAQRDESYRLAYVALTRAEHSVSWFTEIREGGAAKVIAEHPDTQ